MSLDPECSCNNTNSVCERVGSHGEGYCDFLFELNSDNDTNTSHGKKKMEGGKMSLFIGFLIRIITHTFHGGGQDGGRDHHVDSLL